MSAGARSTALVLLALNAWIASCRNTDEPSASAVILHYAPTIGATIHYHVIMRQIPKNVPGRTLTKKTSIRELTEENDGARRIRVALNAAHLANKNNNTIKTTSKIRIKLTRDPRHAMRGEPEVEGEVAGGDDLLRALIGDALVFDEGAIGAGESWAAPPLRREVLGAPVTIPREARLAEVVDGVATLEVTGALAPTKLEHGSATVTVSGELAEHWQIRIADNLLIERNTTLSLTLSAQIGKQPINQRN